MSEQGMQKTAEALKAGKDRLEKAARGVGRPKGSDDSLLIAESKFFLGQALNAKRACSLIVHKIRSGESVTPEAIEACMQLTAQMPRLFLGSGE